MLLDKDELALRRIQRLEAQMATTIYLARAVLSLLKRLIQGEEIPIEQVESLEKGLDSLESHRRSL